MTSVMVFASRNGIVAPCQPLNQPDGVLWLCAYCNRALIRATFGTMNGILHCPCDADVEIVVDGKRVDVDELNVLPGEPAINQPAAVPSPEVIEDDDFLRECGITMEEL